MPLRYSVPLVVPVFMLFACGSVSVVEPSAPLAITPKAESLQLRPLVYLGGDTEASRPLIYLDGKLLAADYPVAQLSHLDIDSIEIVKRTVAATLFGSEASQSIVRIRTKSTRR